MKENFCNLCKQASSVEGIDVILFGEWITKYGLTLHYYCLLLSTHLPQRDTANAGIMGFLRKDIHREIAAAAERTCIYCSKVGASIQCERCKEYFHLICGNTNRCISHFTGEFHSYCSSCFPLNDIQRNLMISKTLSKQTLCHICTKYMYAYHPKTWIYAPCCRSGFVHNLCMQKYALHAGYYLRCIWCRNIEFRDMVKLQGIFVPDREASWESESTAYRGFYRQHQRCDMEICNCPRGRQYIRKSKWSLILCDLCGSFGAHNPNCIPGSEHSKEKVENFTCETCFNATEIRNVLINNDLYESKMNQRSNQLLYEPSGISKVAPSPVLTSPTANPSLDSLDNEIIKHNLDGISTAKDFVILEMYEFSKTLSCLDKVKVKLKLSDPRFIGKTVDDIKHSRDLITAEDIVERLRDLSILKQFDEIIDQYF